MQDLTPSMLSLAQQLVVASSSWPLHLTLACGYKACVTMKPSLDSSALEGLTFLEAMPHRGVARVKVCMPHVTFSVI